MLFHCTFHLIVDMNSALEISYHRDLSGFFFRENIIVPSTPSKIFHSTYDNQKCWEYSIPTDKLEVNCLTQNTCVDESFDSTSIVSSHLNIHRTASFIGIKFAIML